MRFILTLLKRLLQLILILIIGVLGYMYATDATLATRVIKLAVLDESGPTQPITGGGYTPLPSASPQSTGISQPVLDDILAYGETTHSHALLIYHRDKLILEHYYPGYDAATISSSASMHKSVLALLIGLAIEQGAIASVNEPAATYITEWANDERSKITIKQLLQQTSGIDFPSFGLNPTGSFFKFFLGDDVTAITLSQPLLAEPGMQFDYTSVGPETLGILLERATGQKYADYLEANLWQKLGVDDASVQLDREGGMARTFCCLNATARSWLKIGLLHLYKGRLNGAQIVPTDWMLDVVKPGVHEPNYGYLTWLGTEYKEQQRYNRKGAESVYHSAPYVMDDLIYFDGFGGQRVYIIPSEELVIVRTGDVSLDWDDAYVPNTIMSGLTQ
jgi:CubicO group peptidase (beta-lactamase class C family)